MQTEPGILLDKIRAQLEAIQNAIRVGIQIIDSKTRLRTETDIQEERDDKSDQRGHRERAENRDIARLTFERMALAFGALVALANVALFIETGASVRIAAKAADAAQVGAKASEAQVQATKASIDQSLIALKLDQRAWVTARLSNPGGVHDGQPLLVIMDFTNNGKTPAIKVHTCQVSKIVATRKGSLNVNCPSTRLSGGDEVVLPSSTTQRLANAAGNDNAPPLTNDGLLTPLLHEDLRKGKRIAVNYGYVEYDDVFGVHHWTNFCSHLIILPGTAAGLPETNNWAQCEVGNGIDNHNE